MKLIRTMIVAALSLLVFSVANAGVRSFTVKEPGTLAQIVGQKDKYRIESMRLTGRLNAADLLFIADMAGRNHAAARPTEGRLRHIDMRSVVLQRGSVPYRNSTITIGDSTVFLGEIFSNTHVEEVALPRTVKVLGEKLFAWSALHRVVLPDNAEISDSAFAHCSHLAEVVMPQVVRYIGVGAFYGCDALRHIELNNVGYIASHAFSDVPMVETISIKGTLGHIDGAAFYNMPRLHSITFGNIVLSTGGPVLAQNCPLLSNVNFSGVGVSSGFSKVEECPMFNAPKSDGFFMFASDDCYWKGVNKNTECLTPQMRQRMKQHMGQFMQQPWLGNFPLVEEALYNAACFFSLCGEQAMAVQALSAAIDNGYTRYRSTLADTDFDNIRGTQGFTDCMKRMREVGDYLYVLGKSGPYATDSTVVGTHFDYALPTDSDMMRVRQYFHLDSIAGDGDEPTRMKRILTWLHDNIRHDGGSGIPNVPRNSIALYEACRKQDRGLNCRGLAIILSEMYMAMGWPARFITCESKAYKTDTDCHVIDMVWSQQLGKWLWMDPTFNAWVTDENGNLLHPGEVRQHLKDGKPLVLNDEANWNNRSKQTKEQYLDEYMAKNLYMISAYTSNGFGTEGSGRGTYISLIPTAFSAPDRNCTTDDAWFWQSPVK